MWSKGIPLTSFFLKIVLAILEPAFLHQSRIRLPLSDKNACKRCSKELEMDPTVQRAAA